MSASYSIHKLFNRSRISPATIVKESRTAHVVLPSPLLKEIIMTHFSMNGALKSIVTAGALLSLGGCMYGDAGYYGDGYVNNRGHDCDPYAPFDDYYACDSGYGFANIGFGGGWYDQFYYPGYGVYIFDRGGSRHAMRDHHRRHWARQRADYGGHHARDHHRNPERRAERRDGRYERGDGTRDQRRGQYRDNTGTRTDRDHHPATRATRPDSNDQAAPVHNRDDRVGRADRRPTIAAEQPQARPVQAARPPLVEGPRPSPRNGPDVRERVSDD